MLAIQGRGRCQSKSFKLNRTMFKCASIINQLCSIDVWQSNINRSIAFDRFRVFHWKSLFDFVRLATGCVQSSIISSPYIVRFVVCTMVERLFSDSKFPSYTTVYCIVYGGLWYHLGLSAVGTGTCFYSL